jgi:hypothetical protein
MTTLALNFDCLEDACKYTDNFNLSLMIVSNSTLKFFLCYLQRLILGHVRSFWSQLKLTNATKNVEELFAEAFAYYAQGKKIAGHIEKLLEKSLSDIKQNA